MQYNKYCATAEEYKAKLEKQEEPDVEDVQTIKNILTKPESVCLLSEKERTDLIRHRLNKVKLQ